MSRPPGIDAAMADVIYDLLHFYAGAHAANRADFIARQAAGCTEYRFCGRLGFGGKFWNNSGRWYISCYPEHETPERCAVIATVNGKLAGLKDNPRDALALAPPTT